MTKLFSLLTLMVFIFSFSENNEKEMENLNLFPAPLSSPPSAPVLSSTFDANNWIELNWTTPSSDEPITGYTLVRTNTGYQGTISDGNNFYSSSTNSKKDYPYLLPDYDNFVPGTFGFACYGVKAESSAGISNSSNLVCYGVEGSGGGIGF
ncbi:MAG: hypothetical protein ABJR05_14435 [Balneola sp.]